MHRELEKMCRELEKMCRERGLRAKGPKTELAARLCEA